MTSRDRMIAALSHRQPDRVPVMEEIWDTTRSRWVAEGMPETTSFDRYLGIDEFVIFGPDRSFRLTEKTIEETPDYVIRLNSNGAQVKRWKHSTSTSQIIATAINTPSTWAKRKHLLTFTPDRVNWDAISPAYEEARRRDLFVHFNMQFAYERWGPIVGTAQYLMALAQEPDWVRDMHEADIRLYLSAYEEMAARGMRFDAARFSCDMGYRNGLLFSPRAYRELFQPGLKKVCDFFRERGVFNVLHSCGNVASLVPDIIGTGFDCLNPLEVKAGMDLLALKRDYGRELCLMGGIDARKMSASAEAIEEEIRSKVTMAKRRGVVFHPKWHNRQVRRRSPL